jgi:hypothetical protein
MAHFDLVGHGSSIEVYLLRGSYMVKIDSIAEIIALLSQ